ncbi:MAG: nucleoside kinase [Prevotella sp.]|nr:nucleoside kinase [Prevotella sp.]MBR7055462.1 nucleoside kinase [Prevotella sp.]
MREMLKIRCKNSKKIIETPIGSSLSEIFSLSGLEMPYGPIVGKMNNRVVGLGMRIYHNADVEFLDLHTSSGSRTYTRTLFFILCKAVHDLFPQGSVVIDIPVSNGYFCDLNIGRAVTKEDVVAVRRRMEEIIAAKLPIRRHECTTEEAVKVFEKGTSSKVKLLLSTGDIYTVYHTLDGYADYYYGALLPNTGMVHLFGLEPYYDGMLLRIPSLSDPGVLGEMIKQDKMFGIFQEHHRWQNILGLSTVGDFNEVVAKGGTSLLVNVSEALQEKKIAHIAEEIANRKGVRVVLIAGPSSSGKTTTCMRISIQLVCNGLRPIPISIDDYFVDREKTPLDEKGDYDFESLYALNIPLLNEHLNALLKGEEVELPKYNFQKGRSERSGKRLKMGPNDILVIEGIHALNPELTAQVAEEQKFRVYASALTTILLDTHNYIPTTDNRLLRRIVRDDKYRGVSARETIRRWPSVRAGEQKWIFPYQENADEMFNTAMIYELAVIKQQALKLLERVPQNVDEYSEAYRLCKFLRYFSDIPEGDLPHTSLLREFLGGSTFKY